VDSLLKKRVAWHSLGLSRNSSLLLWFIGIGVIGAAIKALHVSLDGGKGAAIAFAAFGGGGLLFAILPSTMRRKVRLARLARLPMPFDRESYFTVLDQTAKRAALEVAVELRDKVVPDASALNMVETSSVRPSTGAVVLVSPVMTTVRATYFGTYFYNGGLDRWFAKASETALYSLHVKHGIVAMRARFVPEGELASPTQTATPTTGESVPKMTDAQRHRTIRWLVGGATPMIALAIWAGLTNVPRFLHALLAGAVFTTSLALGAIAFVLVQLRSGAAGGVLLRRPAEWLSKGIAYSIAMYGILVISENSIWSLGGDGAASGWYSPIFFALRTCVYVMLWSGLPAVIERASETQDSTGTHGRLEKLAKRAPRVLVILAATVWLVSLDWIVGLHREALAPWLAPLVAANLIAGGIAAAVGASALVVHALDRMKLVGDHATAARRAFTSRWLGGACVAWLVTAGGMVAATLESASPIRAAWLPHVTAGAWQGWAIAMVGTHVVALGLVLLGPRSSGAVALAAMLVLLGHALEAIQLVCPALLHAGLPAWLEAGGFVAALVGIWVVVFQSVGERRLYPSRDPALR
jgi:hypothetical protein